MLCNSICWGITHTYVAGENGAPGGDAGDDLIRGLISLECNASSYRDDKYHEVCLKYCTCPYLV